MWHKISIFIWKIKGFNMAQSVVLVITSANAVFFDIKERFSSGSRF